MEGDRHARGDEARLPQERVVDDRELEALGCGGSSAPGPPRRRTPAAAAALLVAGVLARPRRSAGAATPSARSCRAARTAAACSSWATWRRSVSRRSPSDQREHALGQPLVERDRLGQRGDAAQPQHARPVVQAAGGRSPTPRRRPWRPARRSSRGSDVSAAARARARPSRALERLEQPQPLARRRRAEHAAGAVDDGGDAAPRRARRAPARRCGCVRTSTATSPGPRRAPRRPARPSRAAARGRPRGRARRARAPSRVARVALRRALEPGSSRCTTRTRSGAPRARAGAARASAAAHPAVDDALVAELRAAEQRVVGVDQPLVAAPVDRQRRPRAGLARRLQVRVDVGAAERVDRLLGVADQHQRRRPSPNARRMMSHCTGSVSWNSSTSTTL